MKTVTLDYFEYERLKDIKENLERERCSIKTDLQEKFDKKLDKEKEKLWKLKEQEICIKERETSLYGFTYNYTTHYIYWKEAVVNKIIAWYDYDSLKKQIDKKDEEIKKLKEKNKKKCILF